MTTTQTTTTVWADLRDKEVRHTRLIDSHITLCGLAVEHTRNFAKEDQFSSKCVRCERCAVEFARLQAEKTWTWPTRTPCPTCGERDSRLCDCSVRPIDSADFPSDRSW